MRCGHCGRSADRRDQRFCGDCGEPFDGVGDRRGAGMELRDRIAAVYAHPDWSLLRDHAPSSAGPAAGMGCLTAVGLAMTIGATAVAVAAWRRFDPPETWQWAVIGAAGLFSVLAFAWALRCAARLARFLGADPERFPVAVVEQRRTVASSRRGEGRPTHYVTLQREDGQRFEVQCTPRVASRVGPQDIAVAYLRGGVLLDLVLVT